MGVPLASIAGRTGELGRLGADGVFTAEGPHDVFFPLVLAGGGGTLDLMTNAAVAFPRNPVHLAHAAWDLQTLSAGRFRLGLASQVRAHIERRFGLEWSEPVDRLRELVGALRAVFTTWQQGVPLDFEGTYYRHTLMTPMFTPGPSPFGPPPILLGALGPKMTQMAAEVADGLLVLPFHSPRHLRETTMPTVSGGLAASGRSRGEFEVVCGAIVGAGSSPEELEGSRDAVRALLAFYGSTPAYRSVLDAEGWGDRHHELRRLSKAGQWAQMSAVIDDEMVDTLAVTGSPEECAAALNRRLGDLCDRVSLFLPSTPSDGTLSRLIAGLKDPSSGPRRRP